MKERKRVKEREKERERESVKERKKDRGKKEVYIERSKRPTIRTKAR